MNAYANHQRHISTLRRVALVIELAAILTSAAAYVLAKVAGWWCARRAGL